MVLLAVHSAASCLLSTVYPLLVTEHFVVFYFIYSAERCVEPKHGIVTAVDERCRNEPRARYVVCQVCCMSGMLSARCVVCQVCCLSDHGRSTQTHKT